MEILNETVYDTTDLLAFITWVRDEGFKLHSARSLRDWKQYNGGRTPYQPPRPKELPEQLRVGYYSKPKLKDDKVRWTSFTRGRLGIVPPEKMPLVAMQIVALAAADKHQREMPTEVKLCIAKRIMGKLFYYWSGYEQDGLAKLIDQAPVIRWDDNPDKASAKRSKLAAKIASLESAHRRLRWAEHDVDKYAEKLAKAEQKVEKLRRRIAKLEGRDVQEMTRG